MRKGIPRVLLDILVVHKKFGDVFFKSNIRLALSTAAKEKIWIAVATYSFLDVNDFFFRQASSLVRRHLFTLITAILVSTGYSWVVATFGSAYFGHSLYPLFVPMTASDAEFLSISQIRGSANSHIADALKDYTSRRADV